MPKGRPVGRQPLIARGIRLPLLLDTQLVAYARRRGVSVTSVISDACYLFLGLLDDAEDSEVSRA